MTNNEIIAEMKSIKNRIKEVEQKGKSEKNNFRRMFIIDELLVLKAKYEELESML